MSSDRVAEEPRPGPTGRSRRSPVVSLLLLTTALAVAAFGWAVFQLRQASAGLRPDPTLAAAATLLHQIPTASPAASDSPAEPTGTPAPTRSASFGTLFFASRSDGRTRLWAIIPGSARPVAIGDGSSEDRDPAISPDGQWLAFASHRDGQWDLYLLGLQSGEVRRLTDTPGFEGHPTWSPDGLWLAYEAFYDADLDIWILPVAGDQPPIQLTNQPGLDISPDWDPNGRTIAFISDRDGSPDLFLADLDNPTDRFRNLSRSPEIAESDPAFDPDGTRLAYTAASGGVDEVRILELTQDERASRAIGQGGAVAWSPDGSSLAALLHTPYASTLVLYGLESETQLSAGVGEQGNVESLAWTGAGLPGEWLIGGAGEPIPAPLYAVEISQAGDLGRLALVDLPDYPSPGHQLSDAVDEAFNALRQRTALETGWDFLGSLEHGFVGLNDPLPPGFAYTDWLYTGRAFTFNLSTFQSGWVEVAREDLGGQTYWRVYVRTSRQDGSMGEPLRGRPWRFDSRFSGDPTAYDQGGAVAGSVPPGYYVDFTRLAADFGFDRLPAMTNWRTFYPAARFHEFARRDGLDWAGAMAQLYPPEAIVTPTAYRTPTLTPTSTLRPTPTPWWWRWRTPTPSRTPTPPATPTP